MSAMFDITLTLDCDEVKTLIEAMEGYSEYDAYINFEKMRGFVELHDKLQDAYDKWERNKPKQMTSGCCTDVGEESFPVVNLGGKDG